MYEMFAGWQPLRQIGDGAVCGCLRLGERGKGGKQDTKG
jgi:hypothetical protein